MAIFWGLVGAFSFGVADLIAREATLRESNMTAALYLHVTGGLFAVLPFLFGQPFPADSVFSGAGGLGLLVGLAMVTGTLCLYQGLAIGPVLIVAPVVSSFAVVAAGLAILVSREQPTFLQLAGMAVTMTGIVLAVGGGSGEAASSWKLNWLSRGVALGILASLAYGVAFWLLDAASARLGSLTATLVLRVTASAVLLSLFAARGLPLKLKSQASLKWLLPVGLIDSVGTWASAQGFNTGLTSVVSVLVALFAVVTVVLAFFIYKERITRWQTLGIVITFMGVALVSM